MVPPNGHNFYLSARETHSRVVVVVLDALVGGMTSASNNAIPLNGTEKFLFALTLRCCFDSPVIVVPYRDI